MTYVDPAAEIAPDVQLGEGTKVWGLAQIRERASLGQECVVGRAAYIGTGVSVGDRVKIQNLAQIYEPAVIADGVFVGPGAILTNDRHPRAVTSDGTAAGPADWTSVGVQVDEGASIGAGAVCVAPIRIGSWALVAAGAVVVSDVPAHALVAGNPARQIGWVGRAGRRLVPAGDGRWTCPETGRGYIESGSGITEEDV